MVLVDHGDLSVGWHEDPDDPAKFRYWSGKEWTARAQTHTDASGVIFVGAQLRRRQRRVFGSWLLRNPIIFHVGAWLDCSVPLTRGRLGRFTTPVELRTLDQVRAPRNES
jgi:hypothetical protein